MNWKDAPASRVICFCKNVNKEEIICAIAGGARTLEAVSERTTACTGNECKLKNPSGICCSKDILEMIGYYGPIAEAFHWK